MIRGKLYFQIPGQDLIMRRVASESGVAISVQHPGRKALHRRLSV